MEKMLHIGEVAELLQVPRATLRYWQEEGLLSSQKGSNGYREFSFDDLIRLSDIIYLRELQLPIKQIRTLTQQSWEQLEDVLTNSYAQLAEEIKRLESAQQKTLQRLQAMAHGKTLLAKPYQPAFMTMQKIVSFDFTSKEKTSIYLPHPNRYIQIFMPPFAEPPQHGLLLQPEDEQLFHQEAPLWRKPETSQQYLAFLLKEDGESSDLSSHLEQLKARKLSFETPLVAQYLFSAFENGTYYDYYEAWAPILS